VFSAFEIIYKLLILTSLQMNLVSILVVTIFRYVPRIYSFKREIIDWTIHDYKNWNSFFWGEATKIY